MKTQFLPSISFTFLSILVIQSLLAQTNTFPSTGSAGIGTTTPNASSILELKSTNQGILIPRMTSAQRDAIASPATGLMIYQTNNTPGFYYYSGTKWTAVTTKSKGWSLTGNAGTSPGTNFIGTTDAQPLMFKINNNKGGYIDFDAAKANTGFGYQTFFSNPTGYNNTANGYRALYSNSTGYGNTANGFQALYSNTTGYQNTANGVNALTKNNTGYANTATGVQTLFSNTSGYSNVAVGIKALYRNTSKSNLVAIGDSALFNNGIGATDAENAMGNTAVGSKALYSNTIGYANTANGMQALYFNTQGVNNTATGATALYYNTGSYNTATGHQALYFNTTGLSNTATGDYALYRNTTGYQNTANGDHALLNNTNGDNNTAHGASALSSNTTGNANTANGVRALDLNYSGSYNTAVGYECLYFNFTGSYNTALGYDADVSSTGDLTNATAIGYNAKVDASDKVRIGNTDVTSIGGQVGWSSFSDGRYKKNIKDDVKGLSFINSLRPITYTIDINSLNAYYYKGRKRDSAYEKSQADMQPSADKASKIVYNGFIAQDVEAAAEKLNYNFSGVDKPKTKDGIYGLRYSDFVVPLVKAVQQLSGMNDKKDSTIASLNSKVDLLQSQLSALMNRMNSLEEVQQQCCSVSSQTVINGQQSAVINDAARLDQNIPNPFNHTTTINYTLPQKFNSAEIIVSDKAGKVLKEINISGSGKGSLKVDASTLSSGAYQYSLYVDGRLIETKQMMLAK